MLTDKVVVKSVGKSCTWKWNHT